MVICVDFDGTIVSDRHGYSDMDAPLAFMPGAKCGLLSLKRAGHVLVLFSARANRALLDDPNLDPLVRAGVRGLDRARWEKERPVHQARYDQMAAFIVRELPGVFDAIDSGHQGKPVADLYIDDRALRYGHGALGMTWQKIGQVYGEPVYGLHDEAVA